MATKKSKTSRGGRRSDHSKDEIQALAINAAEKIVNTEGLAGLSARKIANEIGYNVAMLYHFFDNQDHIILKVNEQTLGRLHTALQTATKKSRTPRNCIIALGHAYINFALENRNLWNMVFEHSLPDDIEVHAWYQDKVDQMFSLVEANLAPLLDGVSPRKLTQASRAIWCGVHGICALAVTRKLEMDDKEIHALTESLISHYLLGLATAS